MESLLRQVVRQGMIPAGKLAQRVAQLGLISLNQFCERMLITFLYDPSDQGYVISRHEGSGFLAIAAFFNHPDQELCRADKQRDQSKVCNFFRIY